ncbi:MAG: preprotein translocase subunit YajC [Candidatus Omnitrophota bacterium]
MGSGQAAGIMNLLPIILIFAIFYFMIIRPQQKKEAEHKKNVTNLKKNDEVVTIGGLHGTIVNIKENTYIVRIDDNVKVEVDKLAIARVKKVQVQGE